MKMHYSHIHCFVCAALLSVPGVHASTLAEQAQQVLGQTEARQRGTLESLLRNPYPPKHAGGGTSLWHYENFALAAYGLKERMGMLLDLYWADWAIEQIDGVRGGSRHRSYAGRASNSATGGAASAWYHFGIGIEASKHPGVICAATTLWRPSPVVMALALDAENREPYSIASRRPGLSAGGEPMNYIQDRNHPLYNARGINRLAPEGGSLLRTSWVTPDFVLGMSQVEPLPREAWWAASSQNRKNGVIFAGHPTARIFTQRHVPKRGSVYNTEWGVQHKGVMILQRLRGSNGNGQMIWFDHALKRVERDEWVFVDAPQAYAAVRIAKGGGVWREDSVAQRRDGKGRDGLGEWLELNNAFSSIIIEVARKQDYASFDAFQAGVLANEVSWVDEVVTYRSEFYDTTLTLPVTAGEPALIDGEPVNTTPDFVCESPYIQGDFGSGVITLRRGETTEMLDFTQ